MQLTIHIFFIQTTSPAPDYVILKYFSSTTLQAPPSSSHPHTNFNAHPCTYISLINLVQAARLLTCMQEVPGLILG